MKTCERCNAAINTGRQQCPLCGTPLEKGDDPAFFSYPALTDITVRYNLVMRIGIFISVLASGLSLLINFLTSPHFMWSLIVIACLVYLWALVLSLLRRGVNQAKRIIFQVVMTSLLVVALDVITGYKGWSVSFVVPGLFSVGILAVLIMSIFMPTKWSEYIFYQLMMSIFGFIPLGLYFFGLAQNLVVVLVSTGIALMSVLFTIIFGDRSLKNDFIRRFHF